MSELKKTWLVVISAGYWQVKGIEAAIKQGIFVLALDANPDAEGLKIATKAIVVDIKNHDAVLTSIKESEIVPNGVICFASEIGMLSAAVVREYYNLSGPNIGLTHLLTNKSYQRSMWSKKNIPGPDWSVFTSLSMAKSCIKKFELPCIIKPTDGSGSRGVTKVESLDCFDAAAISALKASRSGSALIESFMDGVEYTVETFGDGSIVHVLAVTEKRKVVGTKGIVAQELFTMPDDIKAKKISDTAVKAMQALNYLSGPGHIEIILDKNDKPGLVEAAGRGGGFMIFDSMVEKVSGFDIVTATILQSIGIDIQVDVKKNRSSVLRFIASKKGKVSKISGFSEAAGISDVEVGLLVALGQLVGDVQGDGDRLAYILSEGNSLEVAIDKANQAEALLKITVE